MKKKNIFRTSTLLLLMAMSCNKSGVKPELEDQNSKNGVEVKQKMYNLSHGQIKSSISFLTETDNPNQSGSKNFMPDADLAPDSSIWILEAALNYHFDKSPEDHDVYIDSVEFSAPLTFLNGVPSVSAADFFTVYNQFKADITQKSTGPQKVKIIDITATIKKSQIIYKGTVVLYIGTVKSNCAPFTTETAAWSQSFMGIGYSCPPTTLPDGPTLVANKLNNCPAYDPGCIGGGPHGWYWINVSYSPWFDGYNSNNFSTWFPSATGRLFYTWKNSALVACNGISVVLSAGFLNQYVSGCKTLAASTLPVGFFVANYYVGAYWNPINAGTWQEGGWRMQATYAMPVCKDNNQ